MVVGACRCWLLGGLLGLDMLLEAEGGLWRLGGETVTLDTT